MNSSPCLILMELREQRRVPYLQVWIFFFFLVCSFLFLPENHFYFLVIRLSESLWKNCFDCHTGTGSDVQLPKKPKRPRPSHTSNHEQKHSSANQNESGAYSRRSSTDTPAGNISPYSKNSQREPNVPTDSQSINQNGVDVQPNISANAQHTGQNNADWDAAKPTVKNSNTSGSHQHRDKDSALTSPQKHREKRKHCDSSDADKHKRKNRKHAQDARFEGQRISHLVKKRTYKKEESENNEKDDQKTSDDYVLAKLFKKSGRMFVHKSICHIRHGLFLVN